MTEQQTVNQTDNIVNINNKIVNIETVQKVTNCPFDDMFNRVGAIIYQGSNFIKLKNAIKTTNKIDLTTASLITGLSVLASQRGEEAILAFKLLMETDPEFFKLSDLDDKSAIQTLGLGDGLFAYVVKGNIETGPKRSKVICVDTLTELEQYGGAIFTVHYEMLALARVLLELDSSTRS